jgi:aldose 1-epimerase
MKKRVFGRLDGRSVEEVVLESADAAVSVIGWGASLRDWRVDSGGRSLPMALGFGSLDDYVSHARSHGAIVGRVANRTAGARFELDGATYLLEANEGRHHLHGGHSGLGRRIWSMEADAAANAVRLFYRSEDGEAGYPGAVAFEVGYRLDGPRLEVEMRGAPDRPTPINLAQHAYYNLAGGADVRDHRLRVAAARYTPTDDEGVPTGEIAPVADTRFDFRVPTSFEANDPERRGVDVNLVLDADRDREAPAAELRCDWTGRALRLWTDEPGLQVFNAPRHDIAAPGHDGQRYGRFSGVALEAQHFPDSLHNPGWPLIIRSPENPYFQRLVVEIARA